MSRWTPPGRRLSYDVPGETMIGTRPNFVLPTRLKADGPRARLMVIHCMFKWASLRLAVLYRGPSGPAKIAIATGYFFQSVQLTRGNLFPDGVCTVWVLLRVAW